MHDISISEDCLKLTEHSLATGLHSLGDCERNSAFSPNQVQLVADKAELRFFDDAGK